MGNHFDGAIKGFFGAFAISIPGFFLGGHLLGRLLVAIAEIGGLVRLVGRGVRVGLDELQRIGRDQADVVLLVLAVVE